MNSTKTRKRFPIRFSRLEVGSKFRIFAEPSRGIRRSNDISVYEKKAEAFSLDTANKDKAIILYPDDLVEPLTRGKAAR